MNRPKAGVARRGSEKRKKRKRRRSFVILLLTVAIVGGAVAGSYVFGLAPLIKRLTEPKDYTGAGSGEITVKIPDGASGRTIAQLLAKDDVIKTEVAFLDAAKKDARSTSVQPGTYAMRKQMSGNAALAALLDPKARLKLSVTIPEGTRVKEAYKQIAKKLGLKESDLKKAAASGDIGLPKAAKGRLEGFLFPATYDFQPDVTATEALSTMVERGTQAFGELGIPDSKLRATVIKASIIEPRPGTRSTWAR